MTDLRSVHFAEVRQHLSGNRLAVFDALQAFGPCTGTELAAKIGWQVTSVRPRLTELRDMWHAVETGIRRDDQHEFRAVGVAEAMTLHEAARHAYALEMRTQVRETVKVTPSRAQVESQPELFAA